MFVVLRHQPPGSPLAVAIDPKNGPWSLGDLLLATLVNQVQNLMWGLGGGKGQKPKPIGPFGETQTENYKGTPLTINEAEALRDQYRPRGDAA
ncbi:hypothetical protein ACSDQ9_05760 [Aestuariimicrobium soli]|uniref:hypothetical protein n=1 Tax=Aestuariimicrobium soli TaxID=2035834 RepID=UPI003EB74848